MRKLVAVLLTMALLLGLASTALAAKPKTLEIYWIANAAKDKEAEWAPVRDGVEAAKQMVSTVFAELSSCCDVTESDYGWIGITEKGSNKANAVRFFRKYLNIGSDETAVFGDSSNDIPMFELTENSYAMKNAPADIRQKAKHVTDEDNDHNGAMKEHLRLTSSNFAY